MSNDHATGRNPADDPAVIRRIQRSLDHVLFTARDIASRYSDADGHYFAPDPVGDVGDATGWIATGHNQVVRQLQAALDEARHVMRDVYDEIDRYKRQQLGDAWKPVARPFDN